MKVHCSGDHTASTLQVQQQLEGSAETATPLVILVREDHKGETLVNRVLPEIILDGLRYVPRNSQRRMANQSRTTYHFEPFKGEHLDEFAKDRTALRR